MVAKAHFAESPPSLGLANHGGENTVLGSKSTRSRIEFRAGRSPANQPQSGCTMEKAHRRCKRGLTAPHVDIPQPNAPSRCRLRRRFWPPAGPHPQKHRKRQGVVVSAEGSRTTACRLGSRGGRRTSTVSSTEVMSHWLSACVRPITAQTGTGSKLACSCWGTCITTVNSNFSLAVFCRFR